MVHFSNRGNTESEHINQNIHSMKIKYYQHFCDEIIIDFLGIIANDYKVVNCPAVRKLLTATSVGPPLNKMSPTMIA